MELEHTFVDGNPVDWKEVLDIEVLGVAICTREAFLHMKEAKIEGHIIHINNIAGHFVFGAGPHFSTHMLSPAKHAVTCMTEIMRKEITFSKLPVKVTVSHLIFYMGD